jgi:hypothetical protein
MKPAIFALALLAAAAPSKTKKPPAAPETDDKPPIITHVHVTRSPIGEPITVRARLEDESEIFAPSVYARSEGQGEFEAFGMKHIGDGWEAVIPGALAKTNVEYFIEAFDDQGNGPSREGSPENPIRIMVFDPAKEPPKEPAKEVNLAVVPKDESKPAIIETQKQDEDGGIATKWWFWTIIGVAVTAGIATTVVLLQSKQSTDRVDVMVTGPDPARGL